MREPSGQRVCGTGGEHLHAPVVAIAIRTAQTQRRFTRLRGSADAHALHACLDTAPGRRPQACTGGPPASAIIASIPSAVTGPRNCLATRPSGAIR